MCDWTCISSSTPKARKEHTCCLCGWLIGVGVKYSKWNNAMDGQIYVLHAHLLCESVWSDISDPCEEISEEYDEFRRSAMAGCLYQDGDWLEEAKKEVLA
jgi:hypothetical protein